MNQLNNYIEKTSRSFLEEAKNSQLLIEDMAAMETYMAESYSGRVFVELLQNSDDCKSSKVGLYKIGNNIYFANNGVPFSKDDILAICRTGASLKKRGEKIGYRGVGFKSTTSISDEIIIYSNESIFSFSKSFAASQLGLKTEKVPTVRIPFLVNSLSQTVKDDIDQIISKGFNTVFAFLDADIEKLSEELTDLTSDIFIFLNSINACEISINSIQKDYKIKRKRFNSYETCDLGDRKWRVIRNNNVSLAFLEESEHLKACNEIEGVYHCFLPTLDKTPFPIKINADFSTDPSRKHLSIDSITDTALSLISDLISELISDTLNDTILIDSHFLSLFCSKTYYSTVNQKLLGELKTKISNLYIRLDNGERIQIFEYKMLPEWLEESEKESIRLYSSFISKKSLPRTVYNINYQVDKFLSGFSRNEYTNEELLKLLEDTDLLEKLSKETIVKISSKIIKKVHLDNRLYGKKVSIKKAIDNLKKIDVSEQSKTLSMIADNLNDSEIQFINSNTDTEIHRTETESIFNSIPLQKPIKKNQEYSSKKPTITKWRSAEKQVIQLESFLGNKAEDVSRMNVGYDIESETPNGEKRYIEVKSIKGDAGEFSITNNEYTAAHQYGNQYYICLVFDKKAIYIKNPLASLSFIKRIRQWEWVCDSYTGEEIEFKTE